MRVALTPTGADPTVFSYPSFVIQSTEDAVINPSGARWGFFIFDNAATPRLICPVANMESVRIPATPTTNNMTDIAGYSITSLPPVTNGDRLILGDLYAVDGIFSGNVTANAFFGNGAGLTGIGTGTGGVLNTGSTTIGADTDSNGDGIVSLQTRTLERLQIANDGTVSIAQTLIVAGLSTFSLGVSIPGAKQLSWTTANVAAPSLTDNTIGSRLKLHDAAAPDHTAIGLESGAGWFQTADANAWKFYYAAVLKHTLTKSGLTLSGSLTVPRISSDTTNVGAPSTTDQTTGTRFNYYPAASGEHFAVGVESGALWHNVSLAGSYKFYFGAAAERHQISASQHQIFSADDEFTFKFQSSSGSGPSYLNFEIDNAIAIEPCAMRWNIEGVDVMELGIASLFPGVDNTTDFGKTAQRWKNGHFVNVKTDTINSVKVYRALLAQSGASAPTATVLENSLGGTVVWTRTGAGVYLATLTGAFAARMPFVKFSHIVQNDTALITFVYPDSNQLPNGVEVHTGTYYIDNTDPDVAILASQFTDGLIDNLWIEILVHP